MAEAALVGWLFSRHTVGTKPSPCPNAWRVERGGKWRGRDSARPLIRELAVNATSLWLFWWDALLQRATAATIDVRERKKQRARNKLRALCFHLDCHQDISIHILKVEIEMEKLFQPYPGKPFLSSTI